MTGRLVLVPLLAVLLAGCAAQEPQRPMGQAVRRAVAAQVLDPPAGGTEPVAGLDGEAGRRVFEGYREGFAGEKKQDGATNLLAVPLGGDKK